MRRFFFAMPGKKLCGLQIATEEQPEEKVDLNDYVSHGGSLHLAAKGISITQKGVKGQNENKFLSLSVADLEEIGRFGKGSSGSVKKVQHKQTGQIFAVKEIKLGGDRHLDEISKELGTLYGNKEEGNVSPYIIDFKGAYSLDGSVYIALEAMDGSLVDLISPHQGIPEKPLACIVKAVLKGLEYLHKQRKLVHRDIKPQNLLFRYDGTVKITDFGVCSELESTKAGTNSFVGTVTYMSPERLDGVQYSFSADIWGLGISLIQLATGEHPYEQLTAQQETEMKFWTLVTHLKECPSPTPKGNFSEDFIDFVKLCLYKDKDLRASAGTLLEHPWIRSNTADDKKDRATVAEFLKTLPSHSDAEDPTMSQNELDSVLDRLVSGMS